MFPMIATLSGKRLIVVTGKGGVGKTVVSTALARAIGQNFKGSSKRVLWLTTDFSTAEVEAGFGGEPTSELFLNESYWREKHMSRIPTRVADNVWAVRVTSFQAAQEYAQLKIHSAFLAKKIMKIPLVRTVLKGIPGVLEMFAIGKIDYLVADYDLVVWDAPVVGQIELYMKISKIISDIGRMGPIAKDAKAVYHRLTDSDQTSMVLVTTCEELSINEMIEFYGRLDPLQKECISHVVFNQVHPRLLTPDDQALFDAICQDTRYYNDPRVRFAIDYMNRYQEEQQLTNRFDTFLIPLSKVRVPLLYERGRELIDGVTQAIRMDISHGMWGA